jgi:hypothetical protein
MAGADGNLSGADGILPGADFKSVGARAEAGAHNKVEHPLFA